MKYVLAILATLILFSCNKYDKRLDVILQAAQRGDLIFDIGDSKHIEHEYYDYFSLPPEPGSYSISDNIDIPQYFDSYKFVKAKSLGVRTVYGSANLNNFGELGSKERVNAENIFMRNDSAALNGDVVSYIKGKSEIKTIEFILASGPDRFRLTLYCIDSKEGLQVYLSHFEKINL